MTENNCVSVVFLFHWWLLFGYSSCTCSLSNSIRNGYFIQGKYMESYVMKTMNRHGPRMCLRSCTRHTGCNAINFHWTKLYCELLRVAPDDEWIVNEGFKYSNLSSWKIDTDACWPSKCKVHELCIILTNNDPLCLPFPVATNHLKNVALFKSESQSSLTSWDKTAHSRAVDGNLKTYILTEWKFNNYWFVDLMTLYCIQRVQIYNGGRSDINPTHVTLANLDITVGETLKQMELCKHYGGPSGQWSVIDLTCSTLIEGRYVKLEIHNNVKKYLHFREVKVYGYLL